MASVEAIFIGCNRELQISSYNSTFKLLAYGSNNSISIWKNPIDEVNSTIGVTKTLRSHTAHVVSVQWLPNSNYLISTSEDKTIKVWEYNSDLDSFKLVQTMSDAHSKSVTCLGLFDSKVFLTGGADGLINIWLYSPTETEVFKLIGTVPYTNGFYQLAISLVEISNGKYVVFVGGTKPSLYVYSFDLNEFNDNGLISAKQCTILTGHEDWIKAISVRRISEGEFLIASGSQDRYIRLWKLSLNEFIDNSDQDTSKLRLLSNKQYKFEFNSDLKCSINFDAIIMGHDDWISDLIWHPTDLKLLSASADTSIMIWEPDTTSGIWISKVRLGEMSIKGASTATGSSGGFWSALWIFDDYQEMILTNGKTGSFRCWKQSSSITNNDDEQEQEQDYVQQPCLTGPVKEVTDLSWSDDGGYLLSTSMDQTTRLYSCWCKNSIDGTERELKTWHEFARPQIHGYDMICIKPISNTRFISGGDEKIMRVFDEPKSIANLLERFSGIEFDKNNTSLSMPETASLPVLGLSNKAELQTVEQGQDPLQQQQQQQQDYETSIKPNDENEEDGEGLNLSQQALENLETPPLEDHLQRHTLWPEIEKLYGHGYEITTVDVSPDKLLIASACRSNVASHAIIRIFRTDNWQQSKTTLAGHDLTITRLRFSPNNKYLVGVSRDRKFSLWRRKIEVDDELELVKLQEKAHSRIIWDICWIPSSDMFITGSRDKQIKIWKIDENNTDEPVKLLGSAKLETPITSLDTFPYKINEKYIVAIGLETGDVLLYAVSNKGESEFIHKTANDLLPGDRVSRLNFNSKFENGKLLLAIGSVDSSVRILSFDVDQLKI
ncbi:hypothetical protein CANARDRAFT_27208 [[Candida] arabinofermentans NRRL YB-2248]|uniref:Elongator complex protein 2 n=1 Tax=[Candida] arabinofermentans NRRL YB-2248 TaxID=983967 RepID=A0A1E4T4Z7_9ASCO|nr:hypothetical protein CANARDRAFT_27208 [[Candida] arabinofermentans NRRL YB-2248]